METRHSVLIVDDEELVRGALQRQLTHLGYSCSTASGGKTALEMLRANDFDVALIDLHMPDMDGFSLLSAMQESDIDSVAVMLTSYGSMANAVKALTSGAFDFVEKPAVLEMLGSVIARAVTHRQLRAQTRAMAEVAQQWGATFDTVPDLIAIRDKEQRFIRVNRAIATVLGCTPEDAIGRTYADCPHGKELALLFGADAELLPAASYHLEEICLPDMGRHFLASTSPLRDAAGQLIGAVCVARDVTRQKRTEEELRKAHSEVERLLASMSSFLIAVDTDVHITRWNTAAETILGLPAESVIGKHLEDAGISWDWASIVKHIRGWPMVDKTVRLPEVPYQRPDGTEGFLGISANPIRDESGQPAGLFLLGVDITERRSLEVQLIQAQKLKSIGQLAAGIAHEINTPTQYVGDNLEFLRDGFSSISQLLVRYGELLTATKEGAVNSNMAADIESAATDMGLDYLMSQIPRAIGQSLEGVSRVAGIVLAMKEFSHPESGEKTPIDINRTIESTITVARNEWKYVAEVVTEFDSGLPFVLCLPGEFNQVILNILINAVHAISGVVREGGKEKGTITVTTRRDGDWAEIRIRDTGTGIPEKARNRVFDPFFTTKEVGKGTGQGLAIAHNVICEKHGGTITFETEMGKGTTFIIRLPIKE